jgi:hypothetical protein
MASPDTAASRAANALSQAHRQREALRTAWEDTRNPELMRLAVLAIPRLLKADRCGIFIGSLDGLRAWLEAGTGVEERQIEVSVEHSMVGEVLQTGRPILRCPDVPAPTPSGPSIVDYAVRTALTVPVRRVGGADVVAAVQVLNRLDGQAFDDNDISLLADVAFALQASLERIHDAQTMLEEAHALDDKVAALDVQESSLRSDQRLRVFPPALTDPDGSWLHHRWGGKRYPPFIERQATRVLTESWDTSPDDIFIATHQKVGTHLTKKFVLESVRALFDLPSLHPFHSGDIGPRTVPWPEVLLSQHGRVAWRDFLHRTAGHPRLWFLHNAVEDMPVRRVHPRSRFLVTVRDPRGTAVSQYHFWRRHPLLRVDPDLSMDAFLDRFLGGDLYFGDYHEHVLGWVRRLSPQIRPEQVLVLRYEDLVENKEQSLDRISRFLSSGRELGDDMRARIAASTGFESMKREMTVNPRSFYFNPKVFFRAGKAREWAEQLTPEQVERIDEKTRRVWGGTDLRCPPEALVR